MNRTSIASERTFGTTSASPIARQRRPAEDRVAHQRERPAGDERGADVRIDVAPPRIAHRQLASAIVTTIPSTTSTTPPKRTAGWSRMANGASPASSASGAAIASSTPIADSSRDHHCGDPGLSRNRSGLAPVRRYWTDAAHDRHEPHPDNDQDQVEDGHRHYRTLRRGRFNNRRSHT